MEIDPILSGLILIRMCSIVIHPVRTEINSFSYVRCTYFLNPLYPVVKDEFQFRPLNFAQKFLNANEKLL
jgi:hypothetical protein